jgi:hypothetical protein
MNPQTEILVRTLLPVLFLVVLVCLKQWQILLGISILAASTGFFFLHVYIEGDTMGTLSPGLETHIAMMGMAESAFLKAIFILLLAIFAWLQKEYRHY